MQFTVEVWSDSSVKGSSNEQVFFPDHIFKHIHLIQKISVVLCNMSICKRFSLKSCLAFEVSWRSVAFERHCGVVKDVFLDVGLLITGFKSSGS